MNYVKTVQGCNPIASKKKKNTKPNSMALIAIESTREESLYQPEYVRFSGT